MREQELTLLILTAPRFFYCGQTQLFPAPLVSLLAFDAPLTNCRQVAVSYGSDCRRRGVRLSRDGLGLFSVLVEAAPRFIVSALSRSHINQAQQHGLVEARRNF